MDALNALNAATATNPGNAESRRGFLKKLALAGAAIGAWGLLSKRPFAGVGGRGKSIPANLPGEGSIFQPRGDRRRAK